MQKFSKILANKIQQCTKKKYMPRPNRIYHRYAKLIQHSKNNEIHQINRLQKKNHLILSIDAEKHSTKVTSNHNKILSKLGLKNLLNLIKNIYKKPIANIMLNGKQLVFPLRSEQAKMSPLTTVFQHHTRWPRNFNKETKCIQIGKEYIELSYSQITWSSM